MKRVIAVAVMLAAGSLLADGDDGANTYGLMTVSSSDQRTIVAIPWIQASLTNGEITVADVVRTANLAPDDTIHYYNGTNFESWVLNASTQWVAAVQVNGAYENAATGTGTDADKRVLTRGNALVLMRSGDTLENPIYLWGQVASGGVTTSITNSGYTLIAPPVVSDSGTIDLNAVATWSNVNTSDRIYIQTSESRIECQYRIDADSQKWKWKKYVKTGTETVDEEEFDVMDWVDAGEIPLGTGFLYKADESSEVTATWNNVPSVTTSVNN